MTELVDLTLDEKFIKRHNVFSFQTQSIIDRLDRIPWRKRKIESNEDLVKTTGRLYGDTLSDEMGCVVRRCSDNTWLFGDSTITDKSYFDALFTEVLLEVGIKPALVWNICPRCGKRRLTLSIFDLCLACKIEEHERKVKEKFTCKTKSKFVAWRDFTRQTVFNQDTKELETYQKTPAKIIKELLHS